MPATLTNASNYVGNPAVEQAVLAVSVEVFTSRNHFIDAELSVHGDICVMNTKLFKKGLNSNDVDIELETKSFIVIPNFLHSILISGKISSFEELQFMIPFI